jgi:hypothetical protein
MGLLFILFIVWLLYTVWKIGARLLGIGVKRIPDKPPTPQESSWNVAPREMPVLSGAKMNALRWLGYIPILGDAYMQLQKKLLNLDHSTFFRFDFMDFPGVNNANAAVAALYPETVREAAKSDFQPLATKYEGFQFSGMQSYVAAYRAGTHSPVDVAKRVIDAVKKSTGNQPDAINAIIKLNDADFLAEAEASAERYRQKTTLSEFDGIPITIKDEIPIKGYKNYAGTCFVGDKEATEDACVVKRFVFFIIIIISFTNF